MTFENLPDGWDQHPLDDPALTADVVDLVVGDADRESGCVGLLLLDDHRRLVQPCVVGDIPPEADPADLVPFLEELARMVASGGGAVVFARGRLGSVLLTDTDRAWHDAAVRACRAGGVPLVGAYLATGAGVRAFPVPLTELGGLAS